MNQLADQPVHDHDALLRRIQTLSDLTAGLFFFCLLLGVLFVVMFALWHREKTKRPKDRSKVISRESPAWGLPCEFCDDKQYTAIEQDSFGEIHRLCNECSGRDAS